MATSSAAATAAFPAEQLEDLRATFKLFDHDGDGEITAKELGAVMRQFGLQPSATELDDLMNEIDSDRSGTISFDEFSTIMALKLPHTDMEAELRAAFDVFDTDKNGTISLDELRLLLKKVGVELNETEVKELVEEADKDGNGEIDWPEFLSLMK